MMNSGQFQGSPQIARTVGPPIRRSRGQQFQHFMNRAQGSGNNPGLHLGQQHRFGANPPIGGGLGRPPAPPAPPHFGQGHGGGTQGFHGMGRGYTGGPIVSPTVGRGMLGRGGGNIQDMVQQMMADLGGGVSQGQFDHMQGGYNPGAMGGDFKRAGVAGNPMNMLVQYLTQTMGADGQGTGQYTMDPTKIGMIQQLLMHATRQAQNRPPGLGQHFPVGGGQGFIAGA